MNNPYIILMHESAHGLAMMVQKYMELGYSPIGGIAASYWHDPDCDSLVRTKAEWAQAMILRERNT